MQTTGDKILKVVRRIFLAGAVVFAVFPLLWGLITSLKTSPDIITVPPKWLPIPLTFDHYIAIIKHSNVLQYLFNSAVVALMTIVVCLFVGMHGAYASARFNLKHQQLLMFAILATSMVPGISILVPLYSLSTKLGLHDTYQVLILVYSAWQMPNVLWILRSFIDKIPKELEEAAFVDGCGHLTAFYRVVLPALRPGLAAAAIIVFVFVWNDWLIANTLTISEPMRLVQVGLFRYVGDYGVEWGKFMAYVMLTILPIVIAFFRLEKYFISGLTAGSVKG